MYLGSWLDWSLVSGFILKTLKKFITNVFSRSLIWTCRILNFEYLFWFFSLRLPEKAATNIQYPKFNTSKFMSYQRQKRDYQNLFQYLTNTTIALVWVSTFSVSFTPGDETIISSCRHRWRADICRIFESFGGDLDHRKLFIYEQLQLLPIYHNW